MLEFAELGVGQDLADWIKQHTTFPNTMVSPTPPLPHHPPSPPQLAHHWASYA